jgi:hypothetical protein
MHNVPDIMKESILKLKSLEICPNIVGQVAVKYIFKNLFHLFLL